MLRHKHIGRICCIVLALTLVFTVVCMGADMSDATQTGHAMGYEDRIFDTQRVHTIDIVMEDWDGFIDTCENEEYAACTVVIDGEKYSNVAIRAKGNTSLSSVAQYGNDRYSFKVEFDHYDSGITYHGLDKLSLNNLIQDATFMKDYIVYTTMNKMGVAAPLCSYAYITVNGEDWGLYLAVEGVEESFIERNYGADGGEMYKPDSMSFGGGRGNGKDFDMDAFGDEAGWDLGGLQENADDSADAGGMPGFGGQMPGGMGNMPAGGVPGNIPAGGMAGVPGNMPAENGGMPGNMPAGGMAGGPGNMPAENGGMSGNMPGGEMTVPEGMGERQQGGFGSMGASDVMLQYIDDDPDSYANIFDNAVTDITDADQKRLIASLKKLSEGDTSSVDVDAVIRYFVVHDFVQNGDSYTGNMIHNYYLYEQDGVLSMVPWDYNLAFGGFNGGDASGQINSPIDSPVSGDISQRPMIAWIFASDEYTSRYHELYAQFVADVVESGWLDDEIVRVSGLIAPYVEKDPTAFFTYDEFVNGASALRDFCRLRGESVAGQLSEIIPSTEEGQLADSSSLISTEGVSLSDMGSMNNGRKNGNMPGNMGMSDAEETAAPEADAGTAAPETGSESADAGETETEGAAVGSSREHRQQTTNVASEEPDNMTLMLVCVGVLVVGVVIAALVKGKNI